MGVPSELFVAAPFRLVWRETRLSDHKFKRSITWQGNAAAKATHKAYSCFSTNMHSFPIWYVTRCVVGVKLSYLSPQRKLAVIIHHHAAVVKLVLPASPASPPSKRLA